MHKMLCWIVLVLREMDEKKQVNSTSQQIGSLLRLRFQLKSFNGTSFADVPGVVALSQPIEVFSHTHYLNNKKKVLFMFFFFVCVWWWWKYVVVQSFVCRVRDLLPRRFLTLFLVL
jgi:hypothetical protein